MPDSALLTAPPPPAAGEPDPTEFIIVRGACEHNLQSVDVTIPRNSLCVVTGLSGSGKSSLAFDTIYAEGQRRYVESLSAYARQFLNQLRKPKAEVIDGLSPAISIEQKTVSRNPRSTVGTVTEIYDYLRVLYANTGRPHCPKCGTAVARQSAAQIVDTILSWPEGTRLMVLAPIVRGRKGEYRKEFDDFLRAGFARARVNGEIVELEDPPALKKTHKHTISIVIDRLAVSPAARTRLAEAVDLALRKADGLVEVERTGTGRTELFSEKYSCPACGVSVEEITHRVFSFNSPVGACPKCEGLGTLLEVDEDRLVPDTSLSIAGGALLQWLEATGQEDGPRAHNYWDDGMLNALAEAHGFSLSTPYRKLSERVRRILLYGSAGEAVKVKYKSKKGTTWSMSTEWEGMVPKVRRQYDADLGGHLEQFMREYDCPACHGQRLKPAALAVRLGGLNISEFCRMTIGEARPFVENLDLTDRERQIGGAVLKEIGDRLHFLDRVGLGYLHLDRQAGTLSGGEAQRIRLATQIGSQLTGVLYVLDEPSIGLHQRDNERLLGTLADLRDLGNTVIVVEHDEPTMRCADYLIDLGPGAGRLGGHVVAAGRPEDVLRTPASLTGAYLRGEKMIAVPPRRRKPDPKRLLTVHSAREHNLQDIDAAFPLGLFTCVTGVSGSGKSTLVNDILFRALSNAVYGSAYKAGRHARISGLRLVDKVIDIDQSPIGRTPRSNPATYTGLFSPIRDLFASLPEARMRGYAPGRFSFNVKGGRCDACQGDGAVKVEMHFLPDTYVECETCRGRRYNRETLEVTYHGKSIADVLDMTVAEAAEFFHAVPSIRHKLETLNGVGLGYIHLGQSATTLSGGEAQRVKLAKELSRRATGSTVYLLDEPTTGLHFEDIRKLLDVLQKLTDHGNTVIVIEHNLDVIKCADWILDLGPEGGSAGGRIVAEGPPETIARSRTSATGRFLKAALK